MVRGGGWINVHITNLNTQDLFRKIIHKGGGGLKLSQNLSKWFMEETP